jgi:hypothetical protein
MAVLSADVLIDAMTDWEFVRKHVDGIKFWTQQVDYESEEWPFQGGVHVPNAFARLVAILTKANIPLVVEKGCFPQRNGDPRTEGMCGKSGPFDDTLPLRAAGNEIERMKRIEALGGKVRFFDVDGPIRHLYHPFQGGAGYATIDECAKAFCQYTLEIAKYDPKIEFFALTNFPNWGYRGDIAYWGNEGWGDYFVAVEAIIRHAKEMKAPVRGVTVDNPYDYAIGRIKNPDFKYDPKSINWLARILDLEKYVEEHGLEFNLIINSQGPGETSAEAFAKETLAFLELYQQSGGSPKRYIVQSWYTHPLRTEVIPETQPYTFTWLTREVIQRVKGIK